MKNAIRFGILAVVACLATPARGTESPAALNGNRLWIVGDSTLHAWESQATVVNVKVAFAGGSQTVQEKFRTGQMTALDVTVPVGDLRSHSRQLDKNLQTAMKAELHPDVTFHVTSYVVDHDTVTARGTLNIAGVERPVEITASIAGTDGGIRVSGRQKVRMSDHGIKPPSLMLIRTRDEVIVHFDIMVR